MVSTLIRLDQLPDGAKLLAQAQLEQELQKAEDKGPAGESPAQKSFRVSLLREAARIGAAILKEGADLRFDVGLDAKAKDLNISFALSGQANSELSKSLKDLGKSQSPFAALAKKDPAFLGAVNVTLPESLHKAFSKVVDEAMAKSLADLSDEGKKKQAEQLYAALTPSLRGGQLDGFFALLGPLAKQYTILAGLRLREGDKLGQTVHDLIEQTVKDLPERERSKIHLDADSAGAIKIHRFELPPTAGDKRFQEMIGAKDLYVAFRADAVFFGLGTAALAALKEAVQNQESAAVPAFQFHFDVAKMVPVLAKTPEQVELGRKIFQKGQDSTLRILANGGDALTVRLQMKLSAVEFLAKLKKE
jgi:hypothetical protein